MFIDFWRCGRQSQVTWLLDRFVACCHSLFVRVKLGLLLGVRTHARQTYRIPPSVSSPHVAGGLMTPPYGIFCFDTSSSIHTSWAQQCKCCSNAFTDLGFGTSPLLQVEEFVHQTIGHGENVFCTTTCSSFKVARSFLKTSDHQRFPHPN